MLKTPVRYYIGLSLLRIAWPAAGVCAVYWIIFNLLRLGRDPNIDSRGINGQIKELENFLISAKSTDWAGRIQVFCLRVDGSTHKRKRALGTGGVGR